MLSLVSFISMLSVLLDRYMIILCLALLVNFPAQANPVLSASGSGSGLCVAARPVLCCAVFRSMGSELSTGRILVQDRRSVSRSVSQSVSQSVSLSVYQFSQLDRSEPGSAGVAEAGRTGSDGSMQSRARQGPGQELIAAERQQLRGRKTVGSQPTPPRDLDLRLWRQCLLSLATDCSRHWREWEAVRRIMLVGR